MIRNLLFHLFPVKETIWTWHAQELVRYRDVWNGKKIVVLAVGAGTADEDVVRDILSPLGAEILVRPNSAYYGETAHFLEALSRLESKNPREVTFYAHAKGVTRTERTNWIRRWCDAMYRLNLGNVDVTDRLLAAHEAVGAFRLIKNHSGSPWHYSGTFWWLRHDALFSRDWRTIEDGRWGVEGYPGKHIPLEKSFSLTEDNVSADLLYNGWVTDDRIAKWEKARDLLS